MPCKRSRCRVHIRLPRKDKTNEESLGCPVIVVCTECCAGAGVFTAAADIGVGPGEQDTYNFLQIKGLGAPGDNHGALGRQYLLTKVNDEFLLYNRNGTYSAGVPDSPIAKYPNYFFWPAVTGAKAFVATSDGRVIYDPYGPTSCPTGHFIVVEIGVMTYENTNQNQAGVYLAVSTGEDPDPSNSMNKFHFYWIPAGPPSSGACNGPPPCYLDYPEIGFNTNWIALSVINFDSAIDTLVDVIPREAAECSGTFSPTPVLVTPAGSLSNFQDVCPAETYYNNGTDQYGSTLYLAWIENRTNAQIGIGEITGTPTSPTVNPLVATVAPSPATGWGWQDPVATSQKGDGGSQSIDSVGNDVFTGCVARNNYVWLTHSIGIPWNGTTETNANCTTTPADCRDFGQFWKIATSDLTLAQSLVRWGPNWGTPGQPSTQ